MSSRFLRLGPDTAVWVAVLWCLLALSHFALWFPMLCGDIPAFRDTFHFYYPLEVWLDSQYQLGRGWPHYNPWDGTGINLLGETSSGLHYPGRVLWCLPGLDVAQRMGLLLLVHGWVAAIGAAYAARRAGLGPHAGCVAAIAYSLSTPFIFQHTNLVYYIGAAWTPWALAECLVIAHGFHRTLKTRWWLWIVAASLMLLGGDPQATVHAGLVAGIAVLYRFAVTRDLRDAGKQLSALSVASVIVISLTAIQWLPASYWLQHSQRTARQIDTGIAQLPTPSEDVPPLLTGIVDRAASKSASKVWSTYTYSVAPWQLLTMVWSTGAGHFLPTNSRWVQAFSAEPRMWTPALSIGLLPLCFACSCWFQKQQRREARFLWFVTLLSALAMCGNYAPMWALRHALMWAGVEGWSHRLPPDEVGGVYWCLTQTLPGYASFRYPAKWSVWFACGMTLCAAYGFDRLSTHNKHVLRLCALIAAASAAGLLLVAACRWLPRMAALRETLFAWLANARSDPWLGPINVTAVMDVWMTSFGLALFLSTLYVLMQVVAKGRGVQAIIVLLALAELVYTSRGLIVTVEPDVPMRASQLDLNNDDPAYPPRTSDVRLSRPRIWANVGAVNFESMHPKSNDSEKFVSHVEAVCGLQAQFQLAKLHLLQNQVSNLSAFCSMTPRSLDAIRRRLSSVDNLRADNAELDRALAWLGVSHRLVLKEKLEWQPVQNVRPLCEVVGNTEANSAMLDAAATCELVSMSGDGLQMKLECHQPSTLVVRLYQDGGWTARLVSRRADDNFAAHVNQSVPMPSHVELFQSIVIPQGKCHVQLSYVAPGYVVGRRISGLSLLLAICGGLAFRINIGQRQE